MPTETAEKKPKKRARRNYAKEIERVTTYLETVIRIKAADMDGGSEWLKGELKAYRDIVDFMVEAK